MTITEVKARNREAGQHWFSPSTMRFFRSKVARWTKTAADGRVYFVSSEQFVGSSGIASPRQYTVRVQQLDGSIDTIGEFQAYETLAEAKRAAAEASKGEAK